MSMFSFFSNNKSPSGSNLTGETEEPKSSFSFMSSDTATQPAEDISATGGSGFSFISHGAAAEEQQSEPNSGFSFLSSNTSAEAMPSENSTSSFSFMSQPTDDHSNQMHSSPQKDLMSMEVHQPQDVKLAKVATTKGVVKKKKKATRVGFGREEDEDETTPVQSVVATPHAVSTTMGLCSVDQAHGLTETAPSTFSSTVTTSAASIEPHEHTAVDPADDLDLPPVPPPPYHPATPRESIVMENSPIVTEEFSSAPTSTTDGSSMFSGFNFVNNSEPITTDHLAVSEDATTCAQQHLVESTPSAPASGFGFLSSVDNSSHNETAPQTSSFSFLVGNTSVNKLEEISDSAASNNDESNFGVPDHILATLQNESRKLGHSIQGFVSLYNNAYDMFTQLMSDVIATSQTCNQLTEKILQLEQQQSILAEREEFEHAAVITAEIEAIQSLFEQKNAEKQKALETLKSIKIEYDQKRPSATAAFSNSFDSVFAFVSSAKEVDAKGRKKLDDFVQEENDRLSVEEQRIQMEKNHCEREQATLQSESAVVEEAINTQVGDQLEKKKDLMIQSFAVQEEIRRLEELLAQKRVEEADISKHIKQIDTKILEVRKKYERQLARIAERQEALHKAQSECAYEESIVLESRRKVDSIVAAALESYRILSVQAMTKQQEVKLAEAFMQDVRLSLHDENDVSQHSFSLDFSWYITESEEIYKCFSSGNHLSSSSKELIDHVAILEETIHRKELEITEARQMQDVAHAKLKSLVEIIDRLEVEKKGHAANKRFKEAAGTAKELKEAGEAKEQIESDVRSVQSNIDTLESSKQELVVQLSEAKAQLCEEQKVEKMMHYNIIVRRMSTAARIKRKVEKAQKSYPSDFTQTLLDLYEKEHDRLQKIRAVLVRECDIEESQLPPEVEDDEEEFVAEENNANAEDVAGNEQLTELAENTLVLREEEGETNVDILGETEAYDVSPDEVDLLAAGGEEAQDQTDVDVSPQPMENVSEEEQVPADPEIDREAVLAEISELEKEMESAAESEDYDLAASLMDKITDLKSTIGISD